MAKKVKLDPNKPEYRVPLMVEINSLPWNGLKMISTFTGAGGTCLGFKMAGFKVLWASEFVPAAQEVYRLNHPGTILDTRDIREVQPQDILEAIGLEVGELDVMDGSPPCASFSTAGKREKKWGKVNKYSDTAQRVDDLFFEFARIVSGIRPRVFVAENVSGLVKGVAKGYFKEILAELKAQGYRVRAKLLDAQWLGVPQQRQRIIFVGVRDDLNIEPVHPGPLKFRYSVAEALPWLVGQGDNGKFGKGGWQNTSEHVSGTIGTGPQTGNGNYPPSLVKAKSIKVVEDTGGQFGVGDVTNKPGPNIRAGGKGHLQVITEPNNTWTDQDHREPVDQNEPSPAVTHHGRGYNDLQVKVEPDADMSRFAVGKEWDKLKPGERSKKYYQLSRTDPEGVSNTVQAEGGLARLAGPSHLVEKRKFYISELKRICAFPDDFQLTGSYAQQWERLGRAVPPLMAFHVARVVRDEILFKLDNREPWGYDPECLLEMLRYEPE